MLYQFLLDDVARKQIKPNQLKKKGDEVEYIEDRQGNTNIKNKSHLIRTLSSKAPKTQQNDHIRMHTMARSHKPHGSEEERSDENSRGYHQQNMPATTFGAILEKEPMSATSTDSKRLTM